MVVGVVVDVIVDVLVHVIVVVIGLFWLRPKGCLGSVR